MKRLNTDKKRKKDNTVLHPILLKTNQLNCDRNPLIDKERQTKHQINLKKNKIDDLNMDKKTIKNGRHKTQLIYLEKYELYTCMYQVLVVFYST